MGHSHPLCRLSYDHPGGRAAEERVFGTGGRTRTPISAFWRRALFHLSYTDVWSGEEDSNLWSRGPGPRALDLAGLSPDGTLPRTRTSMVPGNNRLPTYSARRVVVPEAGLEPAISWVWARRSRR